MYGSAELVRAEGKFYIDIEQTRLMREQYKQTKIETRRRAFDEWLYERAHTPTLQDERERLARIDLRYHLTNPSSPEIYSAMSLNTILDQLKQLEARGGAGPEIKDVRLPEGLLKQINVSTGTGGNAGLLKNVERLGWPLALGGPDFEVERINVEKNLPLAIKEINMRDAVDRGRLKDLISDVQRMSERLSGLINDLTPSQYIEARRYLNQLNDALRILQSPEAKDYLGGNVAARGETVRKLVQNMAGLRFAPAAPGEEKAYRELYQLLTAYYHAQMGQAAVQTPAPRP